RLVAHGAGEAPLRCVVAGRWEMPRAELLAAVLLRKRGGGGEQDRSGCDKGREQGCTHVGLRAEGGRFASGCRERWRDYGWSGRARASAVRRRVMIGIALTAHPRREQAQHI